MDTHSIIYRSSKIFYRTAGKGRPVILIHGFAEDGNIWNRQVDFLKGHFRLIIPDLPGSGRSELIPDMSIEGMADLIKEIIDIETANSLLPEKGSVVAVGHSMGGYIILALAEKYPALLSAFALVHSSAYADSEEKKSTRLKSIGFIQKNGAHEFLKAAIPNLFTPANNENPSNSFISDLIEKAKDFSPEALTAYYHAMINRPDRTHIFKNFLHPVLLIIGEHDNAVPFEQSMQQTYLPNCPYIHILRKSAHMGMLEETEKVNTALLAFLKD